LKKALTDPNVLPRDLRGTRGIYLPREKFFINTEVGLEACGEDC